jgi:hypothetical protein
MVDVACAVGDTPCLTAVDDFGYEIDEAEVIYWGRCPTCVAATSVSSDGRKRTRSVRHELGKHSLGSRATTVASNQRPRRNCERGEGAT